VVSWTNVSRSPHLWTLTGGFGGGGGEGWAVRNAVYASLAYSRSSSMPIRWVLTHLGGTLALLLQGGAVCDLHQRGRGVVVHLSAQSWPSLLQGPL